MTKTEATGSKARHRPQVWLRKQEASQQWILVGPALMERVERMNAVIVCSNQRVEFA